jgi:outer membrane cobalamin receptor
MPAQDEAPEPVRTSVTVVGRIASETPANVSEIGRAQLAATPGVHLDERLRQVPGFTLFRRSSSLVAHPTTQGVSLRGIGSSGASRTLVLWDGAPANSPFGGWVYWTQFIPEDTGRVEVSRGTPVSAFGDRAMSGVIGIFSREAERRRLTAAYEPGNHGTHDATVGYSVLGSSWAASGWGRGFTTDGYYIVPETFRGAIDRPAGVRFATGSARVDWFGGASRLYLRSNLLAEDRRNGTVLQNNSTGLGTAAAHYSREFRSDSLSVQAFHTRERFHSVFSAIDAGRNSERLTFRQTVPSEAVGGSALWRREAANWGLMGGADAYRVEGWSTDRLSPSGQRVGGGTQLQRGVYAQSSGSLGPAKLFLGARQAATGRGGNFFSPNAGIAVGRGGWRGRASVYRGFRAPTLNELYREFRVGNAVTQPNADLRPETLFGAEAGLDYQGESRGARVTFFRNELSNLIANVTLSSSPTLIVRQRRNAVAATTRGVEVETFARWRRWRAEAAALYAESGFETGERVPQVPRWQGSSQLVWQRGGTLASVGGRAYSAQFEDDRNLFRLPGFATMQLLARQRLASGLSASVAFENLLGRVYYAGFTPTPTVGAPRLWRAGLRWESTR